MYGYVFSAAASTDGGASWSVKHVASGSTSVLDTGAAAGPFALWAWNSGILGGSLSLVRSPDGAAWSAATTGMKEARTSVFDLGAGEVAYAASESGHIRRSTDRGVTWTPANPDLPVGDMYGFQASRIRPGEAIVAGLVDDGNDWCGTRAPYAVRLASAGDTYFPEYGSDFPSLATDDVLAVISHGSGQTLYFWSIDYTGTESILSRSQDGGVNYDKFWTPFPVLDAVISPSSDALVYALSGTGSPVRISGDGGLTFYDASAGLPRSSAVRLLMNPSNPNDLLVVYERGLPWLTRDGGAHWSPLSFDASERGTPDRRELALPPAAELHDARILNADWDPSVDPPRVFASTDLGIWISDLGFVDAGLPSISFESIAYDASTALLLVGSERQSAFVIDIASGRSGEAHLAVGSFESGTVLFAPNPFRDVASARVRVLEDSFVRMDVFDVTGRRVLQQGHQLTPGARTLSWDGRDHSGRRAAPGTYFVRLQSGGTLTTSRLVLVR
jgi:hypothetical protein